MGRCRGVSMALAMLFLLAGPAFGKSITFGVQAPLSGKYANEGQGIANAVKLIADRLNEGNGLLGRQVRVITCDDRGDAKAAERCAHELVSKGVFAVVGSYTSGATAASQPIYDKAEILQTSDGTAEELTLHGYKLFFRNAPPNSAEARFTAKYLIEARHFERIAVLSDHSSFSKGLGDAVVAGVEKLHGNVVYRGYIKSGATHFHRQLARLAAKHPDVIYFSGYYSEGGRLRAEQARMGINAVFVGGDANQNVNFGKLAGAARTGSVIINAPAPENLPYPEAKTFLKAYKSTYGSLPPSIYTLTNADGMRFIIDAVQKTGSFNPYRVASYLHHHFHNLPYLHQLRYFAGITGPIGFNMFGERFGSPFRAFEIQSSGSYRAVYP